MPSSNWLPVSIPHALFTSRAKFWDTLKNIAAQNNAPLFRRLNFVMFALDGAYCAAEGQREGDASQGPSFKVHDLGLEQEIFGNS